MDHVSTKKNSSTVLKAYECISLTQL